MNDYISVPEFAKLAHKSPQTIYKQLNNRLNQYVKLVDNQKMLNVQALYDVFGVLVEQPYQPKTSTFNQPDSTLILAFEALQKQLEEKDKQIASKDLQISELQQNNRDLTAAITKSLEASHALHAGTIHNQLTGFSIDKSDTQSSPKEPPTVTEEPDKLRFIDRLKLFFK